MTEQEKIKRLRDAFLEFGVNFDHLNDSEFLLQVAQVRVLVEKEREIKEQAKKLEPVLPLIQDFQNKLTEKVVEVVEQAKQNVLNRKQRRALDKADWSKLN